MLGHLTGRLLLTRYRYAVDLATSSTAAAGPAPSSSSMPTPAASTWTGAGGRAGQRKGREVRNQPRRPLGHGPPAPRASASMLARKGWLRKEDVLNTRPAKAILQWLHTPKAERQ